MNDAEKYQSELDAVMRTAHALEQRANHLQGVQNILDLIELAKQRGIGNTQAWKIIEKDHDNVKDGLLALIDKIRRS